MSFMGKGVTKAATLCLRHLAYEMATLSDNQVLFNNLILYVQNCCKQHFL
jgi:hypothetical protein